MVTPMSRHVISGIIIGLLAVLITWVVSADSSPLHHFFLYHGEIPNVWAQLNFPVLMVMIMSGGRSMELSDGLIFMQWFIIGLAISVGILRLIQKGRSGSSLR